MIPGCFIAWLTFPGVIVHEAARMLFCRLFRVPVLDVCFFRFSSPAGYVIHGPPQRFAAVFWIALGPFLVNSLLCIVICLPVSAPWLLFDYADPFIVFLLWLGVSIGMNAFPSTQDANNLWEAAKAAVGQGNLLATIGFPVVVLMYLANIGSMIWLDLVYGIAIGVGLPALILKQL